MFYNIGSGQLVDDSLLDWVDQMFVGELFFDQTARSRLFQTWVACWDMLRMITHIRLIPFSEREAEKQINKRFRIKFWNRKSLI